ncbi:hypothetical protein [Escherichia phage AV121]|jgi:hypothetical protein|uniref:Uncharacterized protein n=5 Tax=Tequatrovirus TaxID=10663 RepID=A0A3G3C009_9CAUD|nr:hypothetical protein KMC00_gp211 [Escherichia phage vB_EcoM_DalCa]YP_010069235.1 hypothetical protein KMC06_gp199 [Escherichia phage vB_EcoM-fFiEco06]YP_010077205.1 hypothetical protein KMC36_gp051 [Yersinia phage PYPS2T]YP_010228746.1 hypothetical protein FDH36_gp037 [Escherichia phage HP3]EHY1316715.1 hypothetical protein [Escherichia coli]EJV2548001.1 hypothetical protein [Shigella flexneri]ELQ8975055.1 hypothetical protein [Shigella sonnei]QBO61220.1 hypothetical protein D5505_00219 [
MMNLTDIIDNCLENDTGDHRALDSETAKFIRITLMNDTLVNSIHPSVYDAIIVTKYPVELHKKMVGAIFIDKKNRFKDGQNIISSVIKSITKLRHEIYRVETAKSAYLVIMK